MSHPYFIQGFGRVRLAWVERGVNPKSKPIIEFRVLLLGCSVLIGKGWRLEYELTATATRVPSHCHDKSPHI